MWRRGCRRRRCTAAASAAAATAASTRAAGTSATSAACRRGSRATRAAFAPSTSTTSSSTTRACTWAGGRRRRRRRRPSTARAPLRASHFDNQTFVKYDRTRSKRYTLHVEHGFKDVCLLDIIFDTRILDKRTRVLFVLFLAEIGDYFNSHRILIGLFYFPAQVSDRTNDAHTEQPAPEKVKPERSIELTLVSLSFLPGLESGGPRSIIGSWQCNIGSTKPNNRRRFRPRINHDYSDECVAIVVCVVRNDSFKSVVESLGSGT